MGPLAPALVSGFITIAISPFCLSSCLAIPQQRLSHKEALRGHKHLSLNSSGVQFIGSTCLSPTFPHSLSFRLKRKRSHSRNPLRERQRVRRLKNIRSQTLLGLQERLNTRPNRCTVRDTHLIMLEQVSVWSRFTDQIIENTIDLDPEYQRGVLHHSLDVQQLLLAYLPATSFASHGFPMDPIECWYTCRCRVDRTETVGHNWLYLAELLHSARHLWYVLPIKRWNTLKVMFLTVSAVSSADDGSELRTCIDGKQRLTSIQRYVGYQSC